MKSYNDFMLYLHNHANELAYDTARSFSGKDTDCQLLSDKEYKLITEIAMSVTTTYLKYYHNWLSEDSEK